MKKSILLAFVATLACSAFAAPYLPHNGEYYETEDGYPSKFGPDAKTAGNVAFHRESSAIKAWATGYKDYKVGSNVLESWRTPEKALGAATGDTYDVVVLGDGGSITLTFANPITNGDGCDFAVFENAFSDTSGFLELGYVEVSTDGEHFVRFPNLYLGTTELGPFDSHSPDLIYNLASKYGLNYGHGFDLAELEYAYNYMMSEGNEFSAEYTQEFLRNYQYVNIDEINYVRIIDIIGDGNHGYTDSMGFDIFDPSNCIESAGFDLQGIGVINQLYNVPEPAAYAFVLGAIAIAFTLKRKAAALTARRGE